MILLAQEATSSGMALAGVIGGIITATCLGLGGLLKLWWTTGSKARIAEMAAQAKLDEQKAKFEQVNSNEMAIGYETMIADIRDQHAKAMLELTTRYDKMVITFENRVSLLEGKLADCENHHRDCLKESGELRGMLTIIREHQIATDAKVLSLERRDGPNAG